MYPISIPPKKTHTYTYIYKHIHILDNYSSKYKLRTMYIVFIASYGKQYKLTIPEIKQKYYRCDTMVLVSFHCCDPAEVLVEKGI